MTDIFTARNPKIGQLQSRVPARATTSIQVVKAAPEDLWLGTFKAVLWDEIDWEEINVTAQQNTTEWLVERLGEFLFEAANTHIFRKNIHCSAYPEEGGDLTTEYPTSRVLSPTIYFHREDTESTNWLIPHGLDGVPRVTARDNVGLESHAIVTYLDQDSLEIGFEAPTTGYAYVNLQE